MIKSIYKFGRTSYGDILERFNAARHRQLEWRGEPLSSRFDVKPLWSKWVTVEEAKAAEQWFSDRYPVNVFIGSEFNGHSECRQWTREELDSFWKILNKEHPKNSTYWKSAGSVEFTNTGEYEKLYLVKLINKSRYV